MAKSYLDKDGLLYFLQKIRPSATPSMDGTASTGTSKRFAAEDHVHPRDTTLAPKASPALTGTPTAPTAATGTSTTQIATTEFVANTVGAMTSGVSDVKLGNTSVVTNGIATIPAASSATPGYLSQSNYVKLAGIAEGAEVNVQSDWGVTSSTSDAYIKNKPTIVNTRGTASSGGTTLSVVNTGDMYTWNNKIDSSARGAANGVAPLNANSKIDATYLPSYVDDVIEAYAYETEQSTPYDEGWLYDANNTHISPEAGKIYVIIGARDTTVHPAAGSYYLDQYRWGGTSYIKLNDGGVSAITNAEIDTIVAS